MRDFARIWSRFNIATVTTRSGPRLSLPAFPLMKTRGSSTCASPSGLVNGACWRVPTTPSTRPTRGRRSASNSFRLSGKAGTARDRRSGTAGGRPSQRRTFQGRAGPRSSPCNCRHILISCARSPERRVMLRLAVSIPTYNRADILADRLARMSRMQRRIALEISISDNASADHTREVVESFRNSFAALSYVRQPRLVSPTINFFAALRNTTFPYVTQIGDDDTIFEDGILQALEMLEAERKLQAVAGNYLH